MKVRAIAGIRARVRPRLTLEEHRIGPQLSQLTSNSQLAKLVGKLELPVT